jgi:hypothetical protein
MRFRRLLAALMVLPVAAHAQPAATVVIEQSARSLSSGMQLTGLRHGH